MTNAPKITPGTKVEIGTPGLPRHKAGLVLGMGSPELLGREEAEEAVLVSWESGEHEWVEVGLLRVYG